MPTSKDTRVRVDGFSKIMRERLAGERLACALAPGACRACRRRLHRACAGARPDRTGRDRGNAAAAALSSGGGISAWRMAAGQARADPSMMPHRLVDLRLLDDQRRQQAHHIVAGADGQQTGRRSRHQLGVRHHAFACRASGPCRARSCQLAGCAAPAPCSVLRSTRRYPLDALRRKPSPQHHVEHRIADRHRQRIAAEGRAMAAGGQRHCRPFRSPGRRPSGSRRRCPWRSPTISGFTPDHSWANSLPVRPMPHCTSSKNSSRPYSSAILRSACRYSAEAGAHAAFALHRLHQDGRRSRRDRRAHLVEIAEGDLIEAVDHADRSPSSMLLLSARRDRRQGAAVEGACRRVMTR